MRERLEALALVAVAALVAGCGGSEDTQCTPSTEVCDGVDNDCDGTVDEGCPCVVGATRPCYGGALETRGVGACHDGVQTCSPPDVPLRVLAIPTGASYWGPCAGDARPSAETCNGADDDCDGTVDDLDPDPAATCDAVESGGCQGHGEVRCLEGALHCMPVSRDTNPSCSAASDVGGLSGDTDRSPSRIERSGFGEAWFVVTFTEDDARILPRVDLHARVSLYSPPGTDFDLVVRCNACTGGVIPWAFGISSNDLKVVDVVAHDDAGRNDWFQLFILVEHRSSTVCDSWDLYINANTQDLTEHVEGACNR